MKFGSWNLNKRIDEQRNKNDTICKCDDDDYYYYMNIITKKNQSN